MTDASDFKSIDKAKDRQTRDKITRRSILQGLTSTREGRRFIFLELERCHVFGMSIALDGDNAFARTAFMEGERNVGNRLLAEVSSLFPKEYVELLRENSNVKDPLDE